MSVRSLWTTFVFLWIINHAGAIAVAKTLPQASEAELLLVTEVYYDTPGIDGHEEWIEIANLGTGTLELNGYKIGDEETRGGREGMVGFPDGATIRPGQVIVVAQAADGFQALFGGLPDYELVDTNAQIADLASYQTWANGDVALANDGDEVILLDARDLVVDSVNYGNSLTYFRPSVADVLTGYSIERVPADCDSDTAADWKPQRTPTPGVISLNAECQAPSDEAAAEPYSAIGEIQGRQDMSPYINQFVSISGVVTGYYEDRNARGAIFNTMFVQDLPGTEDGDPSTSDGIAVFLGTQRPSLDVGNQVQIRGQVIEFFGLTEIADDGLQMVYLGETGSLPRPISINPPADNMIQASYFEAFEGMLVTMDGETRVVGPTHSGCGFAVVRLETGLMNVLSQVEGDPVGQVVPVLHHSDVDCAGFPSVKKGDLVAGLAGPLIYNFDRFKIVNQELSTLNVTRTPLAGSPPRFTISEDQVSVATINLENHFDAFDDTGDDSEPKPEPAAVSAKQAKLAYLIALELGCPTLLGVQEVENRTLLQELAEEVAESCGFIYEVSHLESADIRGIDLGLLSDPRRVSVSRVQLRQACSTINTGIHDPDVECAAGEWPLFSRPPLQVEAVVEGVNVILFVNHFKSKREGAVATQARRMAQAEHIIRLVAEFLDQDASARIVVMGDFNDYELSPTLQLMTSGNRRLLNPALSISAPERYTYIFDGISQLIDGILVSPVLARDVVDVTILHTNADYPHTLATDVSEGGMPFRSSDHDPLMLILELDTDDRPASAPTLETTSAPSPPAVTGEELALASPETTPGIDRLPDATNNRSLELIVVALFMGAVMVLYFALIRRRRKK